jgi:hypothetical protein
MNVKKTKKHGIHWSKSVLVRERFGLILIPYTIAGGFKIENTSDKYH